MAQNPHGPGPGPAFGGNPYQSGSGQNRPGTTGRNSSNFGH